MLMGVSQIPTATCNDNGLLSAIIKLAHTKLLQLRQHVHHLLDRMLQSLAATCSSDDPVVSNLKGNVKMVCLLSCGWRQLIASVHF